MRERPKAIAALEGFALAIILLGSISPSIVGDARATETASAECVPGQPLHATIAACSKAIASDPALANAYAIRGDALLGLMRYDDALADLSKAIEIDPGNMFAHSRRAALYDEQNSRQAKADLDFVLSAVVKTAGDYEARAYVNKVDRHTTVALVDIGEAIKLDPRNAFLHTSRAAIHLERSEWQQAIDEANQALLTAPNSSLALALRADSYFGLAGHSGGLQRNTADYESGIADVTKAIDHAPDEPRLYYSRGRAYELLLDIFKAQHDYEKALELAPAFAKADEQLKKLKQMATSFSAGPKQSPAPDALHIQADTVPASRFRALSYFLNATKQLASSNFQNAIATLDRALSLDPTFADALVARAFARLKLHQEAAALADLDDAITLAPRGERAYTLRGDTLARRGDFDKAFADFDRALSLNPKSVETRVARGIAYTARNDISRAKKEFDTALSIDPRNVNARLGRAEIDLRSGKRQAALATYREIVAADPTSVIARKGLERASSNAQRASIPLSADLSMTVTVVRAAQPDCEPKCVEWIYAEGTIDENTPFRFKKALAAIGSKKVPVFVHSGGGLSEIGYQLGRLIRDHGLDVVVSRTELQPCKDNDRSCLAGRRSGIPVTVDAQCASACVFLLAGGTRRFVGERAVVGVHRFSRYLIFKRGQSVIKSVRTATPASAYGNAKRFLNDMGIAQSLIPLFQNTTFEGIHWLSRDELRATKIMTDEKGGEDIIAQLTIPSWTVSAQQEAAIAAQRAFAETVKPH